MRTGRKGIAKEEVKIYSQLRAAFVRVVWVVFGLILLCCDGEPYVIPTKK